MHLFTSMLLFRFLEVNAVIFCQFQIPRIKLQDKAERRFLPETVMLCENHLAVPRVLKELNKCHSLCIKIQKVAEDRVRTP